MEIMAEHDKTEERDRKRCQIRERKLEDLVETEKQTQDRLSRDAQLVSSCSFLLHFASYST